MERTLALTLVLTLDLLCSSPLWARPSEYQVSGASQCESLRQSGSSPALQCTVDGDFSPVQCSEGQCWCVDAQGQEVSGTRYQDSAPPHCPSRCQLQSDMRCSSSGLFETVQCDSSRGQCWCVDTNTGMEIYGSRQKGRPHTCPGPCSVLSRGLLHSSDHSSSGAYQCADDGSFLPVQCKFINSTDKSQMDLTSAFSRYPEAFQTFSSFRQAFPEVYSYCFCSDFRGKEIPHTALELVLDQIHDSAPTGDRYGSSFSESNIYRVLKRRLLGVQLLLTGTFTCPSRCEGHPGASCEPDGSFSPTQCLQGGQCWCVDPQGREVPGTRANRDSIHCGSGLPCVSQRRSALLRLFSPPLYSDLPPPHSPLCSSLLRTLLELIPVQSAPWSMIRPLLQVLDGLFPSVDSALAALSHSSPKDFLENLFGGKFLTSVAEGNTGAIGSKGLERISSEAGLQSIKSHRDMVQILLHVLEDPGVLSALKDSLRGLEPRLSITEALPPLLSSCSSSYSSDLGLSSEFVPRCSASGEFEPVQCLGEECWCMEPDGREVQYSRTRGRPARCPSLCEKQRKYAIKLLGTLSAGAEIHVPACSADGYFLPLQCVGGACFCVDQEGRSTADIAPQCPQKPLQTKPSGSCAEALAEVAAFKQEVRSLVSLSNSSHFPLGLGFLLAKGFHFAAEIGRSEPRLIRALGDNTARALRLAAVSVYEQLVAPHKQSFKTYSPQCDAYGHWMPTQCDLSTGQCWCVDDYGRLLPGSLTNRRAPKCASRCERARAHSLLSDWLRGKAYAPYRPSCEQDGRFSALQTEGTTAVCVNPDSGEREPGPTATPGGELACPGSVSGLQCESESESPCYTPQCSVPDIYHGALQCDPESDGSQRCHLVCSHGYYNALPVDYFLCDVQTKSWTGTKPGATACQIPQPLQTWSWSQSWSWLQSCSEYSSMETLLLKALSSRGLCSAQAPVSAAPLSLCDDSTVELYCEENYINLTLTWTLDLSYLKPEDLPDLHTPGEEYSSASKSDYSVGTESLKTAEPGVFLNRSRYVEVVRDVLTDLMTSQGASQQLRLVTVTTPRYGCAAGFGLSSEEQYCVLCPGGTFSSSGTCHLCPAGTYQDQEGRDYCVTCPRGHSAAGASSVHQCQTECQRRGGRCSESGDFLPAQPDILSGIWGCVTKAGTWLQWTNSETALTDKECTALSNFQLLPESEILFGYEEAQILRTVTADRTSCLKECALDSSCHHVALYNEQCEMYSTSPENTECTFTSQTKGFLGNPEAEIFDYVRCSVKVKGGAADQQVFRKTGDRYESGSKSEYSTSGALPSLKRAESGVYRTQVFSANQSSPSDVHRFCLSMCRNDPCCEGFVLNQNSINSGSLMCGYLRGAVLMCSEQDWDVIGRGNASRECGAGLSYNEKQGNFLFDLGGQTFTFSAADAALSDKKKGYSASLVTSSSVYLYSAKKPGSCPGPVPVPVLTADPSVLDSFDPLTLEQVELVPQKQPSLTFWFNKKNYDSHQALLSCLKRCEQESLCSVADMLDLHKDFYFCELFPDTGVCGSYDKPLRRQCRPQLHRAPNNTFTKKVDLSGPVKSFYQRVAFKKMVSYSVRNRIPVPETTALSQGFRECERRCDEDHCCRGFGLVRDPKSPNKAGSEPGLVCLPLISLGIQTCPEEPTGWTTQDCSPSELRVAPEPLGWYLKPVNQWTSSPGLCPYFSLDTNKTVLDRDQWSHLSGPAHLLVDPALRTYDVIHLSHDIIKERQAAVDWCLYACQESSSCFGVSVSDVDSGLRCLLYPDTSACDPNYSCQLTIREPASEVYVRTGRRIQPQIVPVPGYGTLLGQTKYLDVDSERTRAVVQFLGVPFAQPPVGLLRFLPAQPANWTGDRDATESRYGCVEPGQTDKLSEDCLYLNVFTPQEQKGELPVLVFFHNAPSGYLDASLLAARGNLVVVTAPYRSSVLGFGFADAGLSDQEAVLQWVYGYIYLMGGAKEQVTVGAERQGADMLSVHLSKEGRPKFNRIILMGGSVFSPVLVRSESETHLLTRELAQYLGCDISGDITACLQDVDLQRLNAAQTKILAKTGPLRGWGPVLRPGREQYQNMHYVDLLLGTSESDGLISRARRIKNFEELEGRADSKTVFYEALVRSLGQNQDQNRTKDLLKEAASWFYSLDHKPTPASYNLFSRALNNATRDLFVVCPSLKMAYVWAQNHSNVYMYHLPTTPTRTDPRVPLDLLLLFADPLLFSETEQRLSVAMMTYVSSFVRSGDPNPARAWPESVLPRWGRVQSYEATPTYLELSHTLKNTQGLRQRQCSFWNELAPTLRGDSEKPAAFVGQ